MADKSIAVLGAEGMLGTDVTELCRKQGYSVSPLDLPRFDLTDSESRRAGVDSADAVINCAAYTNVDKAESQRAGKKAFAVNAEAVGRLGQEIARQKKWLLHISTDFVFDGEKQSPYTETDTPNPINAYGKTKLKGEEFLAQTDCRHCILRIQWTYGAAGPNFVTKIRQRAQQDRSLQVVDDQVGSPTATVEVAKIITLLTSIQPEGIFHFAANGYASRYQVARFICDHLGPESAGIDLKPCKTADFAAPAKRPLNSRFDCGKITRLLDYQPAEWQKPLKTFMEQL